MRKKKSSRRPEGRALRGEDAEKQRTQVHRVTNSPACLELTVVPSEKRLMRSPAGLAEGGICRTGAAPTPKGSPEGGGVFQATNPRDGGPWRLAAARKQHQKTQVPSLEEWGRARSGRRGRGQAGTHLASGGSGSKRSSGIRAAVKTPFPSFFPFLTQTAHSVFCPNLDNKRDSTSTPQAPTLCQAQPQVSAAATVMEDSDGTDEHLGMPSPPRASGQVLFPRRSSGDTVPTS